VVLVGCVVWIAVIVGVRGNAFDRCRQSYYLYTTCGGSWPSELHAWNATFRRSAGVTSDSLVSRPGPGPALLCSARIFMTPVPRAIHNGLRVDRELAVWQTVTGTLHHTDVANAFTNWDASAICDISLLDDELFDLHYRRKHISSVCSLITNIKFVKSCDFFSERK